MKFWNGNKSPARQSYELDVLQQVVGATRETVTAELNKLKAEGIIEFDGKHVIVMETARLEETAQ